MFNKELKEELKVLKNLYIEVQNKLDNLLDDYDGYLEWKKMADANSSSAAKQGKFYIQASDLALLEKFIQEVNKDPDLAVLMTTAEGTTLTLRSHPQQLKSPRSTNYGKYSEEE